MTFLLCTVVYAVAISKPGFGVMGPLVVGYTLFASAFIGGPFTGAALNPARVLGPALVYNCYWWAPGARQPQTAPCGGGTAGQAGLCAPLGGSATKARSAADAAPAGAPPALRRNTAFIYIFAQFVGGIICALISLPLYGPGPEFTRGDAHESVALAVQARRACRAAAAGLGCARGASKGQAGPCLPADVGGGHKAGAAGAHQRGGRRQEPQRAVGRPALLSEGWHGETGLAISCSMLQLRVVLQRSGINFKSMGSVCKCRGEAARPAAVTGRTR